MEPRAQGARPRSLTAGSPAHTLPFITSDPTDRHLFFSHAASEHCAGERKLCRAVLEHAIAELWAPIPVVSGEVATRKRREHAQTAAWFASNDRCYAFSFAAICEAIGYHPDYIRRLVAAGPPSANAKAPPPLPQPPGVRDYEFGRKLVALLTEHGTLRPMALAALTGRDYRAVHTTLRDLRRAGRVLQVGRGLWMAVGEGDRNAPVTAQEPLGAICGGGLPGRGTGGSPGAKSGGMS